MSADCIACTQARGGSWYDYIDEAVPVLARMSEKRIKGYRSFGYSLGMKEETAGAERLG